MKPRPALVVFICVVTPATGVAGQAGPELTRGIIRQSIAREAVRAAAVSPIAGDTASGDSRWSRVRRLKPGTAIVVTVTGSPPGRRSLVQADESSLTALALDDPALPAAAKDFLIQLASEHPESFMGGSLVAIHEQGAVRVAPDGVFVDGRRVADLRRVVGRVERRAVLAVATAALERNAVGCALVGHLGGFAIGGVPGAAIGGAVGRDSGPALVGALIGWSAGAVYVYRKCRHTPERVIYQAASYRAASDTRRDSPAPESSFSPWQSEDRNSR